MRLSLQTMDYRLAKLEDVTVQASESLFSIQDHLLRIATDINRLSLLTPGFIPTHRAESAPVLTCVEESPSTAEPLLTIATSMSQGTVTTQSSVSPGVSDQFPPGPTSAVPALGFPLTPHQSEWERAYMSGFMQCQKWNEDRLRPFTDYTKPVRRPQFSRAVSLGAPTLKAEGLSPTPSDQTSGSQTNKKGGRKGRPYLGSELYQRRRHRSSRSSGSKSSDQSEDDTDSRGRGRSRVSFQTEPFTTTPPIRDPNVRRAYSETTATVADPVTQGAMTTASETSALPTEPHHCDSTKSIQDDGLSDTSEVRTALSRLPRHLPSLDKAVMPLTPIVTPTRVEYSSITDDIDTACVSYRSPPGSPTTPRVYFGVDVDVDLYTRKPKHGKKSPVGDELLKRAEESVCAQMENIIRKRMRQISLTESDSLGDIAKHVMQELEQSDKEREEEPGYHSDTEDIVQPRPSQKSLHKMKKIRSEPSLKHLGSSPSHSVTSLKSKSMSPPVNVKTSKGIMRYGHGGSLRKNVVPVENC